LIVLTYSANADPGSALISCIFLSPPLVTNNLLALASCGKTLLNCPTTCFSMFGGASCSKGSNAGSCTHFCRIFFNAFLLYNQMKSFKSMTGINKVKELFPFL
jgi:hypothetical protein